MLRTIGGKPPLHSTTLTVPLSGKLLTLVWLRPASAVPQFHSSAFSALYDDGTGESFNSILANFQSRPEDGAIAMASGNQIRCSVTSEGVINVSLSLGTEPMVITNGRNFPLCDVTAVVVGKFCPW